MMVMVLVEHAVVYHHRVLLVLMMLMMVLVEHAVVHHHRVLLALVVLMMVVLMEHSVVHHHRVLLVLVMLMMVLVEHAVVHHHRVLLMLMMLMMVLVEHAIVHHRRVLLALVKLMMVVLMEHAVIHHHRVLLALVKLMMMVLMMVLMEHAVVHHHRVLLEMVWEACSIARMETTKNHPLYRTVQRVPIHVVADLLLVLMMMVLVHEMNSLLDLALEPVHPIHLKEPLVCVVVVIVVVVVVQSRLLDHLTLQKCHLVPSHLEHRVIIGHHRILLDRDLDDHCLVNNKVHNPLPRGPAVVVVRKLPAANARVGRPDPVLGLEVVAGHTPAVLVHFNRAVPTATALHRIVDSCLQKLFIGGFGIASDLGKLRRSDNACLHVLIENIRWQVTLDVIFVERAQLARRAKHFGVLDFGERVLCDKRHGPDRLVFQTSVACEVPVGAPQPLRAVMSARTARCDCIHDLFVFY